MSQELTINQQLRRAGTLVYLATEESVAADLSRIMFAGAAEIERLQAYIWTLDGKTICSRIDGDKFMDEGFIRASDITPPATNSAE